MKSFWELDFTGNAKNAITQLQGAAKDAFTNMGMMEKGLQQNTETTTASLHSQVNIMGTLREAAMEYFTVTKLFEVAKDIIETGTHLETLRTQMDTLTGSTITGGIAFNGVMELWRQFPLINRDATMQAAEGMEKVGIHADQLKSKLYAINELAEGNPEQVNELASAYDRATAKGFVNARMLLSQPVLLQEIGRMHKLNGIALQKFMTEGNISVADMDKAFAHLTGTGGRFHNMLENLSNTMGGKWAEMKMKLEEMGQNLFQKFAPFLSKLIDFASNFITAISPGIDQVLNFGHDIMSLIAGIGSMFGQAALHVKDLGTFFRITLAIGTLGMTELFRAFHKFEGFREVVMGIFEVIKQYFTNFVNFWKAVLAPVFQSIDEFRQGHYAKAAAYAVVGAASIVTAPIRALTHPEMIVGGLGDAYARGKQKGANWKEGDDKDKPVAGYAGSGLPFTDGSDGGDGNAADSKSGAQGKNIIITIQKMVGIENLHTSVSESMEQMEDVVTKRLLTIFNDAETAM